MKWRDSITTKSNFQKQEVSNFSSLTQATDTLKLFQLDFIIQ